MGYRCASLILNVDLYGITYVPMHLQQICKCIEFQTLVVIIITMVPMGTYNFSQVVLIKLKTKNNTIKHTCTGAIRTLCTVDDLFLNWQFVTAAYAKPLWIRQKKDHTTNNVQRGTYSPCIS